jgi:MFS family permease
VRSKRKREPAAVIALVAATAAGVGGGAFAAAKAGWRWPFGIGYVVGRVRQLVGSKWKRLRATASSDDDPGLSELSRKELYERARDLDIEGRSSMTKAELADAVSEHQ